MPRFLIIESDTITKVASRKKMMSINGMISMRAFRALRGEGMVISGRAVQLQPVQSSGPTRVEVQGGWPRPECRCELPRAVR
jgi:hypothetical protein